MKKNITSFLKKRSAMVFFFISLLFIPLYTIFAESMQSNTYRITSDSINVGGEASTSTTYSLDDTLGEVGTGDSNSNNYYLHAGFWQMQESYISISTPADLALTHIGGINGETTEGTMSWQIVTDNTAGYVMDIKTTTIPALRSADDSFSDYTPAGTDPDYNFSILSSTSAFGFSPEGVDTNARFKDNGLICNTGTGEVSGKCWDGLSTSPKTIAGKGGSNQPTGSAVNVRFRAESGSAHIQTSGSYSASIVVTALVL
ncbi:MAG: hypothetical protein WC609_03085 [Candidatus Paceibacterota bacterium]|jgi:hypothetical protein